MRRPLPRGASLVELVIVMAILGVITSVAAPAIRIRETPPADSPQLRAASARRKALQSGVPVTTSWATSEGTTRLLTAWPDGHISADSLPRMEAITGLPDTLGRLRYVLGAMSDSMHPAP